MGTSRDRKAHPHKQLRRQIGKCGPENGTGQTKANKVGRGLLGRGRGKKRGRDLKRIARSGENDYRRSLLAECLEAYANLDDAQQQRLQELLTTAPYQEVRPLMTDTYQRVKQEGRLEGLREAALRLLQGKFGPLSAEVAKRVETLTPPQLDQLLLDLLQSPSLKDLQLQD
jgi:hypothetical protein